MVAVPDPPFLERLPAVRGAPRADVQDVHDVRVLRVGEDVRVVPGALDQLAVLGDAGPFLAAVVGPEEAPLLGLDEGEDPLGPRSPRRRCRSSRRFLREALPRASSTSRRRPSTCKGPTTGRRSPSSTASSPPATGRRRGSGDSTGRSRGRPRRSSRRRRGRAATSCRRRSSCRPRARRSAPRRAPARRPTRRPRSSGGRRSAKRGPSRRGRRSSRSFPRRSTCRRRPRTRGCRGCTVRRCRHRPRSGRSRRPLWRRSTRS